MSFGENLRTARQELGLSQGTLGEALGMAPQTISKWEREESMPDAALLPALADILGCSLDRLFGRTLRRYEDVAATVKDWLLTQGKEERWQNVLRLGYEQQLTLAGIWEERSLPPSLLEQMRSLSRFGGGGEEGFFLYCREEKLSFLTLFPEPEAGWENALEADDPALWEALGNGEVRRTLRALYPLAPFQQVDRSYLTRLFNELGITDPEGVLEALTYLEVIRRKPCRLDGKETEFYHIYPHLGLLQLLLLGSASRGDFATASFHPRKTEGVANKDR